MPYRDGSGPNGDGITFGRGNGPCGASGHPKNSWLRRRARNWSGSMDSDIQTQTNDDINDLKATVQRLSQIVEDLAKRS